MSQVQTTKSQSNPDKPVRLYTRIQVREMLGGVSRHTLWRLEKAGKLHAVHLNRRSDKARVFYRHSEIMALVGSDADAET